jgi:hypothetical protein
MDLREIMWSGMYWIHLVQEREQWKVLVRWKYNVGKFLNK